MSSNGGGGSNLLDMGLMIAAGVAAPELAPILMEGGGAGLALGETAATAATGAGLSGLAAAATGQNVLRSAGIGALGGALSGALGPASNAGDLGAVSDVAPVTEGAPIASETGDIATNTSGEMLTPQGAVINPQATPTTMGNTQDIADMAAGPSAGRVPTATGVNANTYMPNAASSTAGAAGKNFLGVGPATNLQMGVAGLTNAYGYQAPRPGAYTPPNAIYTGGPLQKFKYDPNNYQPDVVTPPTPLYHAQYAQGGITALAKGGKIKKYGFGGFLDSLVETPVFHAQQAAETYENHPEQAIAGINTPAEARVWNGATGSQYQPTTNMYGGPTQADYAKGQQQGVNMTAGHVADSVVPIVAGAVGSAFGGPAGGAAASYGAKMANQMGNNYEDNLLRQQYYQNPQAFNQQYGYVQGVNYAAGGMTSGGTGRYDAIPSASDSSYFDSFPEIIAQALKESPANSLTMNVRPAYAAGGMASGGISTLGSYSDGGRLLKGPGDGMSDSIPAKIGGKQEARLADGEFVIPSDVVSGLGNGSTDAGAKHLYKMMDKVRHARTGRKSQGKQIKSEKYLPA